MLFISVDLTAVKHNHENDVRTPPIRIDQVGSTPKYAHALEITEGNKVACEKHINGKTCLVLIAPDDTVKVIE